METLDRRPDPAKMGREDLQKAMGLADRKSFHGRYLAPAIEAGFIEMTIPTKAKSRLQKYRLTDKGRMLLAPDKVG